MKLTLTILFWFYILGIGNGQTFEIESLHDSLYSSNLNFDKKISDSIRAYNRVANYYKFNNPDSGIYYATKALALSRNFGLEIGELDALYTLGLSYMTIGDDSKALRINLEGLKKAQDVNFKPMHGLFLMSLGRNYYYSEDYEVALDYFQRSRRLFKEISNQNFRAIATAQVGQTHFKLNQIDSAIHFSQMAKQLGELTKEIFVLSAVYTRLGDIHKGLGNADSALFYFYKAYPESLKSWARKSYLNLEIAKIFYEREEIDSCIWSAEEALQIAIDNNLLSNLMEVNLFLTSVYEKNNPEKALSYNKAAIAYKDSLIEMSRMASFKDFIDYDEQQRAFELENERREYRNEVKTEALSAGFLAVLIIALLLYRNIRVQKKSKRKTEVAYDRLKTTQTQLIHSEKMASLGELTAGIAHEIQNPLNFVNNFSEINKEMLAELRDAVASNDQEEVEAILKDLEDNEDKVTHHGKRAEQIVKSMLQHSRTGSGEKELTDINALCDEYLRLSYHGYRAKDKSFQSDFKLDLDPELPKINVVPQDIGRVLLNLINNAFQAVKEVEKPEVAVITKLDNHHIIISVKDNGPGIPEDIKDKIFQPFFTTKPTGEGTGLGLSMSYDIVTKGHGGALEVKSKERNGTEFTVTLPVE